MPHENPNFSDKPGQPPEMPELYDPARIRPQQEALDKEQNMAIAQLEQLGTVGKARDAFLSQEDDPTSIIHVVTNGLPVMAEDFGSWDGKTDVRIGMMPVVDADGKTLGSATAFRFSRMVDDPKTGNQAEAYAWVPIENPYFGGVLSGDFSTNDARLAEATLDSIDGLHDLDQVPDLTRDMTAIAKEPDQPFRLITAEDLGADKP